jgi:hypothetical protein
MEWTLVIEAVIKAYKADMLAGISRSLSNGVHLGDIVIWLHENGEHARILHRDTAREALSELPQAEEWITSLGNPAPVGCFWLFISGEGTGGILISKRLAELSLPGAQA